MINPEIRKMEKKELKKLAMKPDEIERFCP